MLRKLAGIVELCGRHWHPQVLATSSQMPDVLATLEKLGQSTVCMNLAGSRRNITTSARVWGELFEFPLAQTGEGIAECEIIKWLVKVGPWSCLNQKLQSSDLSQSGLGNEIQPHLFRPKIESYADWVDYGVLSLEF